MVTIPLGLSAYKRQFGGEPEIKLINRYAETDPSNLREYVTLLARPGTSALVTLGAGFVRGSYSKPGLFNGDLFIVSGPNLYRYSAGGVTTPITGTISGTANPYVTWMKGIGYEYLFIADGTTLQYYSTHAVGTLTLAGGNITNQVITINGVYYSWSASVNAGTPAGTIGAPYLALLGSGGASAADNNEASLANMVKLINNSGIAGVDYSSTVTAANASVTATSNATTLVVTAIADGTAGNAITTTLSSGSFLTWSGATLAGGGSQVLQTVAMPNAGEVAKALATLSGFVLVSVGNTQKFYWLNPGEVVIDALNFAEKESNPDNIVDMHTVGDQVLITGDGSTESWYATGQLDFPFLPVEGRVYHRGTVAGTSVVVKDSVILVGNDGIVYELGGYGAQRISTHGIEERIRTQMRRIQGLP